MNPKWVAAIALAAILPASALAGEAKGALYGDLRWSFDYAEDDSAAPGPTYTTTDNNSVWGVKASTTQGGVTVFGGYERYIDDDERSAAVPPAELTRQAYIGISSYCGVIKVGRHATAYSEAGRKLDPFYDTALSGIAGVGGLGLAIPGNSHGTSSAFNADAVGAAIMPDHIAYESPSLAGLRANLAFFTDESGTANQDHDYGAGLEFDRDGITAGLQFLDANSGAWGVVDQEAMRLYGGYAANGFGIGASWERVSTPGAMDPDYLMVAGWYGIRPGTRLAASWGGESESGAEGQSLRFGVFHDLIENFTIWAAVRHFEEEEPADGNPDADVITLGGSYKFNLGFSSN